MVAMLICRVAWILAVLFFAQLSGAGVIIDAEPQGTGSGLGVGTTEFEQQSWTETQSYTNVSISVFLASFAPSVPFQINAFLTTDTGASATPPPLAMTSFSGVTASFNNPQNFLLFSGLTLGPGTYYLTLSGSDGPVEFPGILPAPGSVWLVAGPPTPILLDTGVNLPTGGSCASCAGSGAYPPTSVFTAETVFGDPFALTVASVPEPSTMITMVTAIGCLVMVLWLRRNTR